jgi:hypothetical protein
MLDEAFLSEALRDAAEAIDLPEGATDRVLAAARTSAVSTRSLDGHTLVSQNRRGRRVLVAAVVVVAVGGITASVEGVSTHGPASSSKAMQMTTPKIGIGRSSAPGGGATAGGSRLSGAGPTTGQPAPHSPVRSVPSGIVGQSAKVEANGSVDLTIGDGTLQSVLGELTALASAVGGFISSTQAQLGDAGSGTPASGTIVLRVPEANFGTTVTQAQRYGHATSVTTSSEDVTGQYVNLQAQIAALQASRQQYLTIMTRASSIGDILAVQNQIDSIQSDIDQLQGQLNVLDNETTYGTLTVALTEAGKRPPPAVRPRPASSGLTRAWDRSVGGFVSGFEWIVRIAGPLLLVLLCLAGLLFLGRFTWRVARRRLL